MDECKIKKGLGFEIICEKTKEFIENYLFGKKLNLMMKFQKQTYVE